MDNEFIEVVCKKLDLMRKQLIAVGLKGRQRPSIHEQLANDHYPRTWTDEMREKFGKPPIKPNPPIDPEARENWKRMAEYLK